MLPAACLSDTAISSMAAPPPMESTAMPVPPPSPPVYPARLPAGGNTLHEFNSVSAALKRHAEGFQSVPALT